MDKVIGIISYLPDTPFKRAKRQELITNLVSKLDELFNLPIIIVAQNWKGLTMKSDNCHTYYFDEKLGITGAREKLREIFLDSAYDYLIMLDDDCELSGDRESARQYLQQIDEHPKMFYEFKTTLLKLFAIHRDIFKEQGFEGVNPENGDGFEDRVFVGKLRERFPNRRYIFRRGTLTEKSTPTKDPYSTWYDDQDLKEMVRKTNELTAKNN